MRPILFTIPIVNLPIYGYGLMLFIAFLACNWLGQRLCRRQGIDPKFIPDLAIWLFVAGILGGRIAYVAQPDYWPRFRDNYWSMVTLWDGGLVLYGALLGGIIGHSAYHYFVLRNAGVSWWRMLDVVAPCVALGIALGRIGCLCTGCCFGNVACPDCLPIHFPYGAPGYDTMVKRGNQSPFGFILKERTLEIAAVEPGTPAENAGLQPRDILFSAKLKVLQPTEDDDDKEPKFEEKSVRIQSELQLLRAAVLPLELTVIRDGKTVPLQTFTPTSIGLHPTQIYETISMCLMLFLLLSYFPYRQREGQLMVILMIGYSVHRYLNEMLRTDTNPFAFGLTISQNISLALLTIGVILALLVWRLPPREEVSPWVEPPPEPAAPPPSAPITVSEGIEEKKT